MNKKIPSVLAIGIILILSVIIGGLFFYQNLAGRKEVLVQTDDAIKKNAEVKKVPGKVQKKEEAPPENNPDPAPDFIANSPIVFQNGEIYLMRNISAEPEIIGAGASPLLSPDKSKVAYYANDPYDCLGNAADDFYPDDKICLYDIAKKKTGAISTKDQIFRIREVISWSPDGKYFVVNSGTYVIGSIHVYRYADKKHLAAFSGDDIEWISNDQFIFSENVSEPEICANDDQTFRLTSVNLPSGAKKRLFSFPAKEFTALVPRDSIGKTNEDSIYYTKFGCSAVEKGLSWKYDIKEKKHMPTEEPRRLDTIVAEKLPPNFSGYYEIGYPIRPNKAHPNWVLFPMYKRNVESYDRGRLTSIFIMNLEDPVGSLRKIADGEEASW